jgi:hypothetical protein
MYKKTLYCFIILTIVCISLFCCEKEKIETDPAKAILGKWEIIEMGNWPDMDPIPAAGYTEFTLDSIVRFFEYSYNQFTSQGKYWIDDSLFYESYLREDGFELVLRYLYQFLDNNQKLRLDIIAFAIFNTSIFKRIN